jgi:hypothetical protein
MTLRLQSPILLAAALLLLPTPGQADGEREVHGARIELSELVPGIPEELAGVDLGQSPPPGSSRIVTKKEIERQLRQAGFEPKDLDLPARVRAVSPSKKLNAEELASWFAPEIQKALPSGVSLVKVKATTGLTLSPSARVSEVRIPKLPKRPGSIQTGLTVVLTVDREPTHHLPLTAVVDVDPSAARYDMERGNDATLVIQMKSLRVAAQCTALSGADVGDTISFRVKSTGQTLLGRVQSSNQAVVVDSR